MGFENISYTDDADYQKNKDKLSIKDIVLQHIKKISMICCSEFIKGHWNKHPTPTATGILITEVYVEDTRKMYCEAINFLVDVLYPISDDAFKKYVDDNEAIEPTPTEEADIIKYLIKKRGTFREINKMFERKNFFRNSESVEE